MSTLKYYNSDTGQWEYLPIVVKANGVNSINDKQGDIVITKEDLNIQNIDNTSDADKPVSTAQQTELDKKVDKVTGKALSTNDYTTPEKSKLAGIAAGAEVNVQSDWNASSGDAHILNKPTLGTAAATAATDYATAAQGAKADTAVQPATLTAHTSNTSNPHSVTKAQVGLGNVDNTSDVNKPVSTATQNALDTKATTAALSAHEADTANPHSVTKAQVGLGNVPNLAPADMPVSTATQAALDTKAATTALNDHTGNISNPHSVTKSQVGLSNVDNTSDANKPVSTAQQTALNAKANASDTVNLTGDQTIAGVKTFSSSPIVPTATTNTQAVNKAQMDTADALKVSKAGDTITGNLVIQTTADTSFTLTNQTAVTGKSYRMISSNSGVFGVWNTTDGKTPFRVNIDAPDTGLEVVSNGLNIQGVRYLTGTGFPNGVVTAPTGSIYIDKAVTNGASSWVNKSGIGNTGWSVLEGNTGCRNITSLCANVTSGNVYLMRNGNIVTFALADVIFGTQSGTVVIATTIAGFTPPWSSFNGAAMAGSTAVRRFQHSTNDARVYAINSGDALNGQFTWTTTSSWPATLPGTAA